MTWLKSSAVLLTVLSMAWLSSTAPPDKPWGEEYRNRPKPDFNFDEMEANNPNPETLSTGHLEYEQELNSLESYYEQSQDVHAMEFINWIRHERVMLAKSKQLYGKIRTVFPEPKFWALMAIHADYEYAELKKTQPLSMRARIAAATNREVLPSLKRAAAENHKIIRSLLDEVYGSERSLTKSLLNLLNSPLRNSLDEPKYFREAIDTAIKYDSRKGLLTDAALRDIARDIFRIDRMYSKERSSILREILTSSSSSIHKYLTPFQIQMMLDETTAMLMLGHTPTVALYHRSESLERERLRNAQETRERFNSRPKHSTCGYMRLERRRRRSTSDCFLSEEEYREIVRKVDEEGDVKEVLDTEKFLELLDRVTAEDSAAKRQQLLELGADLSEDPEVSLKGDYITQFRETVKPLDQTVPGQMLDFSHSQLPENPMGLASPSESRALPLDHLSPGEIYSSHLADRISAYPQEILHRPINIHEPTIYPKEFGGVDFRVPEFHEQIKPVTIPEIIRPIEITPIKILPVPEIRLPIPEFGLPMIRRG